MAATTASLSSILPLRPLSAHPNRPSPFQIGHHEKLHKPKFSFRVQAAKLPAGVELPKREPRFPAPFFGFTNTAETWNSRACMIGLIGTFIVELILNKGILQTIGVEVGKGLDLPL